MRISGLLALQKPRLEYTVNMLIVLNFFYKLKKCIALTTFTISLKYIHRFTRIKAGNRLMNIEPINLYFIISISQTKILSI